MKQKVIKWDSEVTPEAPALLGLIWLRSDWKRAGLCDDEASVSSPLTDGREARDLPLPLHRLARLRGPRVPSVFPQLPL